MRHITQVKHQLKGVSPRRVGDWQTFNASLVVFFEGGGGVGPDQFY